MAQAGYEGGCANMFAAGTTQAVEFIVINVGPHVGGHHSSGIQLRRYNHPREMESTRMVGRHTIWHLEGQ
jgi:hypothetical protein